MPRYYVPASGNIQAGDELFDHGPTTNNNNKATREVDPDTNQRSPHRIGTATQALGGERIRPLGPDLVIDPTSKGPTPPHTVVGRLHLQAGAPGAPPPIRPAPGLPPAKPAQPGVVDTAGAQPIDVVDGPADNLIGDALTRDPDTGKLPKKPYVPDNWQDFRMKDDDFWKMLKEEATR